MRIARSSPPPRVAFLYERARALHVPTRCEWADAVRVEVPPGGWDACAQRLAGERLDACLAFDPGEGARACGALPGLRLAVVLDALRGQPVVAARRAGALDAFTWPVPWARGAPEPFQLLPPPLDEALLGSRPAFAGSAILVAGWAPPPPEVLARLGPGVRVLPAAAGLDEVAAAAEEGRALVACPDDEGARDPRLLAALARGLLVVSSRPLPAAWAVEAEDEYLVRAPEEVPALLARASAEPLAFAPVRARAWQRARESFSSAALERLVLDARTLLRRGGPAPEAGA